MNERNKQKWKNLTNSRVGLRNKIGHPAHRHKGADSCVEYPRNIHKVLTRDTEYRIALNNGFSESSGSKRESFREIKQARKPEMILYSTAKASQLCTKPSQLCTTPSQLYNTAKPSQLYNTAKPNQLYNTANTSQPRPNMAEFMHRHTARGEKWREREREVDSKTQLDNMLVTWSTVFEFVLKVSWKALLRIFHLAINHEM